MGNTEKPQQVQDARLRGDHEALQAMARKGGNQAAINNAIDVARKEEAARKAKEQQRKDALEQAKIFSLSPDGDVLPPDPNSISNLEEQ